MGGGLGLRHKGLVGMVKISAKMVKILVKMVKIMVKMVQMVCQKTSSHHPFSTPIPSLPLPHRPPQPISPQLPLSKIIMSKGNNQVAKWAKMVQIQTKRALGWIILPPNPTNKTSRKIMTILKFRVLYPIREKVGISWGRGWLARMGKGLLVVRTNLVWIWCVPLPFSMPLQH